MCLTNQGWKARNRYLKELSPIQKRLKEDIKEHIPQPMAKPILRKKDEYN